MMIMKSSCLFALLAAVAVATAGVGSTVAQDRLPQIDSPEHPNTIVVGRISEDPKKQYPRIEAMANYLASRLGDWGIERGEVRIVASNDDMVVDLRTGRVDVLSETAISALYLEEQAGAEILLREWKKGVRSYRSVFITRKDADIKSLTDLTRRKIAFEDPGSTSGFLLPMAVLRQQGLQTSQLTRRSDNPSMGHVGYFFATGEINVVASVAKGIADAGAISDLDWQDAQRSPESLRSNLVVFHQTEPFLRSTIVARKSLDPKLKSRIVEVLLAMAENNEGRTAMATYGKVSKYDRIEGQASIDLETARRTYQTVRDLLDQ